MLYAAIGLRDRLICKHTVYKCADSLEIYGFDKRLWHALGFGVVLEAEYF
jgi:hypothetical protein